MRVLMLAIRYDVNDWATNFIPVWVRRLAGHVAHVDVLALEVGDTGDLPPNVRVFSMGKAPGVSKAQVLATFYQQAARMVPTCDVVFVHMIPRYAWLVAPLAIAMRKPITLWYTHRNASADLRRALPLVKQVVTAVQSSFPLPTDKVQVLGHGIDTDFFAPFDHEVATQRYHILHVARVQPIKRQDVLLDAMPHLPEHTQAVLVGAVPHSEDETYHQRLQARAAEPDLIGRVRFAGGLPADEVRDWYYLAAAAVNLSPVGLFDKAPLESMATGLPTLVTNPAFDPLLGDWRDLLRLDDPPTPEQLAERLRAVLALPPTERATMGEALRANTVAAHSLDALIPRLANALESTLRA